MSFFELPIIPNNKNLIAIIDVNFSKNQEVPVIINKTLMIYLKNIKKEIDYRQIEWDKYKKYTNPYEYIHTCYDSNRVPISKYKPLSRAFYKMIELINMFDIFHDFQVVVIVRLMEISSKNGPEA